MQQKSGSTEEARPARGCGVLCCVSVVSTEEARPVRGCGVLCCASMVLQRKGSTEEESPLRLVFRYGGMVPVPYQVWWYHHNVTIPYHKVV